jgi:hypothetical protein
MAKAKNGVLISQRSLKEIHRLVAEGRSVRTPEIVKAAADRVEELMKRRAAERKEAAQFGAINWNRACDV